MNVFQFYFIKSRLSGLVLDIEKGSTSPGAKVIPWEKHGKDNQLWYDDPITGTIRSKLTNFCLDVEGGYTRQIRPGRIGPGLIGPGSNRSRVKWVPRVK